MKTFLITLLATIGMLFSVPVSSHEYGHYHQHPNRYVDRTGRPYYTCPRAYCYNSALDYNPYYSYHNRYTPRVRQYYRTHYHGPRCGHNVPRSSWGVAIRIFYDYDLGTTIYYRRDN